MNEKELMKRLKLTLEDYLWGVDYSSIQLEDLSPDVLETNLAKAAAQGNKEAQRKLEELHRAF